MEERRNKSIFPVFALVCITLLVIALGSYAYWQVTRKQQDRNVVGTACLNITYGDELGDIDLENQYPMTDAEGAGTDPYQFTIINECDAPVNYIIGLESIPAESGEPDDYLDYSYLRVKLDDDSSTIYGNLTDITNDDGVRATKKITEHTLAANGRATHYLRLWIDEETPAQNADETLNTGKYFYGKIKVIAGQGINGETEPLANETRYNLTFKSPSEIIANISSVSNESLYLSDEYIPQFVFDINGNIYSMSIMEDALEFNDPTNDIYYELKYRSQDWGSITPPNLTNVKIISSVSELSPEWQAAVEQYGVTIVSNMDDLRLIFDIEEASGNNTEDPGSNPEPTGTIGIVSGDINTVGSEVKIGDEHFYVIGDDEETSGNVKLLAKYNLLVGESEWYDYDKTEQECYDSGGSYSSKDGCYFYVEYTNAISGYNRQSNLAKGFVCDLEKEIVYDDVSDREVCESYGGDYDSKDQECWFYTSQDDTQYDNLESELGGYLKDIDYDCDEERVYTSVEFADESYIDYTDDCGNMAEGYIYSNITQCNYKGETDCVYICQKYLPGEWDDKNNSCAIRSSGDTYSEYFGGVTGEPYNYCESLYYSTSHYYWIDAVYEDYGFNYSLNSAYSLNKNQSVPYVYYDKYKNVDSNNLVAPYVDNYVNILESDYGIEIDDARLLSYEEAQAIAYLNINDNISSFLGSAYDEYSESEHTNIYSWFNWSVSLMETYINGVRPVISVSKDIFN